MNEKELKAFELDKRYLRMARIWSENSYAIRRQVGCLIVKDRMIISDGYNGTPSGFENICEEKIYEYRPGPNCNADYEKCIKGFDGTCRGCGFAIKTDNYILKTKPYVLHAEANALSKLAKSLNNSEGATLYVTDEPCLECSKMIIQAGIKRVVFWRDYHSHDGVQLLLRAGIKIDQISNIE